ncbi:trehalose-phosphatase [Longibacter salinarum]|uniref:Trehalose 6-phosphate phosphatase n=1 Tax=Longibacter salinarum TaxID=1850348 RepID=A0A2A8D1J5_9BACT|nr:trehalose-phosphatase [Longibacter salinarum]PEN14683.1 trehalose-phosphatase [Longibacter salinarum]
MPPVVDKPLFFLDYDGTLAPIVDDPEKAVPHPDIPPILQGLSDRYPVWIVTGRDIAQLGAFIDLPLQAIGLHGSQAGTIGGDTKYLVPDEAAEAISSLRQSVPSIDGVRVEDKSQAFAVHYRNATDEEDARERLKAWTNTMPEILEAIWGKKVVELRPEGWTKGTAVRRIASDYPDHTPVYLGDDVTDEDAFEELHTFDRDTVTIKVGNDATAAHHRLRDPDEVVEYLRSYLSASS